MLPSLKVGRLFGIPVYLHSSLILLPAWVIYSHLGSGWPATVFMLIGVSLLFGCVLLHEFGHVLMARWFGVPTRDVTLYPIGGVARLERMAEKPVEEIFIALAGPAVNVLIAALLTPVLIMFAVLSVPVFADPLSITFADPVLTWLGKMCGFLWFTNITLVLFNMLPAFPMDGGRVLRAVLAHFFGLLRGTEIAVPIGIAVILLFAFTMMGLMFVVSGSINPMPLLIAGFIALIGPMELRALRYREQQKREAEPERHPSADVEFPYTAPLYRAVPYPEDNDTNQPVLTSPPSPEMKPGFTGYTWDREYGVWVKWQDGRRVAAHWHGAE